MVILAAAAYLAVDKWYSKKTIALWNNVPGNAVLVFEASNTVESWEQLVNSEFWKALGNIEAFEAINTELNTLDSLNEGHNIQDLLQKNGLISMHVTEKNDFDFVFYIDLNSEKNQRAAGGLLDKFKSNNKLRFTERLYQGYKISEISDGKSAFTYFLNENVLVGSFTSFLVEDVVRLVKDNYMSGFRNVNASLFDMPKLANDDGNIYLNMNAVSLWLSSFVGADARPEVRSLTGFCESLFFDLDISDDKFLLNGFTLASTEDFISTFNAQTPVKSGTKYYIPNRAALVYQFGLSHGVKWHQDLQEYWKKHHPDFYTARGKFARQYEFDFNNLYGWLGNSIDLVQLEIQRENNREYLLYIHANDISEALNQLNTFSESLANAQGDSVYVEKFSTYNIREMKVKDFPKQAFGPMYEGFEECYFTPIGDYIVMGNSIMTLKSLIEDIESENTWGRSVAYNKFLEGNLEESNVAILYNTRRLWNHMVNGLDPKWKAFAEQYSGQLKSINLGSLQFSRLDENFYSSIALQFDEFETTRNKPSYEAVRSASLAGGIITRPHIVKNHTNGAFEVAVQDSAYNFVLISEGGEVLWRDSLGSSIISDVEQVDYYKNGKLQYFFATSSAIHIIDRLGNYIDGYPVAIDANLKYASVVDYDKSKKYRFFLADDRGNLYLYNKEGVSLEGWNPRELNARLAGRPFHIRVRGKDAMIAIQQDGIVNIMNRRGEMMPGFPLQLDGKLDGDPFINVGSELSNTVFTVISREGRIIKFNMEGQILSTEQLYKPTVETRFTLVPDALGKNYIISRQDLGRLVLLSSDNKEILSKDYMSSEVLKVQYYDFGSDHRVYAVTDMSQSFTYIYDNQGTLVNSRPFDSENEIALMYFDSTKKYHVYTINGDTFKVITF